MPSHNIPGELPHRPPNAATRNRLMSISPYVRQAQETMRPAWHIKPRRLFDYLFIQVLSGSGVFEIDGKRYTLTPGDLYWIPPNTLHEMRGDAPGTHLLFIHFDLFYDPKRSHWSAQIPGDTTDLTPWKDRIHPPINDSAIAQWCGRVSCRNPTIITETLRRIIMEYNRKQTSNLLVGGLCQHLVGLLLENKDETASSRGHHAEAIELAMHEIQRRSQGRLNLEALAQKCNLSPTHFRKLFREYHHQSPRSAHLNAKMRDACDYLVYSDLSITEIADRLGFTAVHNFSRAFHKEIGIPPSIYRSGKAMPERET